MNRRVRTVIVLGIAVVCATLATVAMLAALGSMRGTTTPEPHVPVVVAARDVAIGSVLTGADVKVVQWPERTKVLGSYAKAAEVVGRGLKATVVANEPLTDKNVAREDEGYGLAPVIVGGKRAISVRVNDVIGVAGFILPGTRVDVLATIRQSSESMSRIVVANVEVLTAGTLIDEQKAKKDGKPVSTTVVTLMVTPEDAQRIALAATEGQILLTLRNPADTNAVRPPAVRTAALMTEAGTPRRSSVHAPAPPPPPPPPPTYEKIAGSKKTTETIVMSGRHTKQEVRR